MKQLSELNSYASVNVDIYELTDEMVSNYNIIVLINSTHDEIVQILNFCHSGDIKLMVARTGGLFRQMFCDLSTVLIIVSHKSMLD